MHNYIKFFKDAPVWLIIILMICFGIMQGIGEILEFKGKIVPEFMKIRKLFSRRKKEREALSQITDLMEDYRKTKSENSKAEETLEEVKIFLNDVRRHYSDDNITKRDSWMQGVNNKFEDIYSKQEERDALIIALNEKIDKNNADTLSLLIDNKRNYILDFASKAADLSCPITREQYNRFFKVYKEYEDIIIENCMTNGEVDIAYRMAAESYEDRLKNHGFVEDIRGY